MKKLLLLPFLLLGCAATTNIPSQHDLNYDQQQQYEANQRQVEEELNRRNAESYDSQTRSDIDKAVERNRKD